MRLGDTLSRAIVREENAMQDPMLPSDFPDDLTMQVRRRLQKSVVTATELANEFDVSPRRIEGAIKWLTGQGFSVAVKEEGAAPQLMIARGTASRPEIRIKTPKFYDGYKFSFGLVSDTHLCSKYYRPEVLNALYDVFAERGIKYVFHGGNWIDGEARFNRFDITAHGVQNQVDTFVRDYPRRDGITTYIVSGDDHEGWYQQREGIDIGAFMQMTAEKAGRKDLINLGYVEGDVVLNAPEGKCIIKVVHAGGGSAYALSYAPQKLIESLEGGEKPDILCIGHYHKADYLFYRNVHCFQMGTTKSQDPFMRKKRIAASTGGWACTATINREGSVTEMNQTFFPFFDRTYYEALALNLDDDTVTFNGPNEEFNIARA